MAACVLSDRCGGCDWMALSEDEQRRTKEELVLSALERTASLPRQSFELLPTVSSPVELGYRRRRYCTLGPRGLATLGDAATSMWG